MGNPNQFDLGGVDFIVKSIILSDTPGGSQTTLSGTEISVLDGVTAGTATASKAVVLGASKEIATITTATITNLTSTTITPTTIAGAVNFTGTPTFAAGETVTGSVVATAQLRSSTSTALGTTGTISLDPTLGQVFTVTPTGNITLNAASAAVGSRVYLIITTSGTSTFNVTPTTNFKTTGALATGATSGKVFTLAFVGDGTNLNEIGRTTAM